MKELFEFELIKAKSNYLYPVMFIIMILVLFITLFYHCFSSNNYIIEQQQLAMQIINQQQLPLEVKQFYLDIIDSNNYEEIYRRYNQIDSLNQEYLTDLDYDYMTNIAYRNYHLNHQLDPDDYSGGLFIYDNYHYFYKYIVVIATIIISLNLVVYEKQLKTHYYLLTLNYHLKTILLIKGLISIIVCCLIIILPLLFMYFLSSFVYGFSDKHIIVAADIFANVLLGNTGFITINLSLMIIGLIIVLLIILINMITFVISYLIIKNRHKVK